MNSIIGHLHFHYANKREVNYLCLLVGVVICTPTLLCIFLGLIIYWCYPNTKVVAFFFMGQYLYTTYFIFLLLVKILLNDNLSVLSNYIEESQKPDTLQIPGIK